MLKIAEFRTPTHQDIREKGSKFLNPLTPNDLYMSRTAPLTSKLCILYIYSTNVGTEYIKHALYSPFFPLQNAVCFIMLTSLVPVLFTFYIQVVLKLKKNNSGAKGLIRVTLGPQIAASYAATENLSQDVETYMSSMRCCRILLEKPYTFCLLLFWAKNGRSVLFTYLRGINCSITKDGPSYTSYTYRTRNNNFVVM